MPELTLPMTGVRVSFVEFLRESRAAGPMPSRYADLDPDRLSDAEEFREYVQRELDQRLEETPRPPDRVPGTTLWWVERAEYLGQLGIRHRLTPTLERVGGHIGYDIRPSVRRRGHATAMLKAALPVARSLGIDRALITCDTDNVASRKVIEKNGGEFIDEVDGILRFRVPT